MAHLLLPKGRLCVTGQKQMCGGKNINTEAVAFGSAV